MNLCHLRLVVLLNTNEKPNAHELSTEVSNVPQVEEIKTVKIKNKSHVDHFLRCAGYQYLTREPRDQSVSQQGNPATNVSFIVW